ncbi:rRNA adenine N-6-methyltransferase family protein [Candidatus Phytoplasma solani]|uniref:rRNA adenine N-6-methyltransferase family protein n=1 Tax=Candidatus Phytoplasma solani TaxID=69896 RepID=UPI0032D9F34C
MIISFITLIWGIVHSCFQNHLPEVDYFQNIFNFTRQSVFLIFIIALLTFSKYKTKQIYFNLSFVALINILIVGLVFGNFIRDDNQSYVSNESIIALTAHYLQYILLPLFYCFYFYQKKLTFVTWRKGWLVLIHPFLYFLIFFLLSLKFSVKSPFIIPDFLTNNFLNYFKIFIAFSFLTMVLIGVSKIKINFILKALMLVLVFFLTSVIPREISDWNHAKELILHPQQMGSSLFPETQEMALQMVNLVLDENQSLKDNEKILELGSGSGNVTKYLVEKFGEEKVIALEYDSDLCQVLKNKYPKLKVIHGDAADFINLLKDNKEATKNIKGIVSTLPLSNFSKEQLNKLNEGLSKVIRANNIKFVEYRFLPFLREKHLIEGVEEKTNILKNRFFVSGLIIPTKIFIFEKNI